MAKTHNQSKWLAHTVLVLLAISFVGLSVVAFKLHPLQESSAQTQYAQPLRGPSQPAQLQPVQDPIEEKLDAAGTAVRLLEMIGNGRGEEAYNTHYVRLDELEQKMGVRMVDVMVRMGEMFGRLKSCKVQGVQQFPSGLYGPETEVTMDCVWEKTGDCLARVRLHQSDAGRWMVVSTFMVQ